MTDNHHARVSMKESWLEIKKDLTWNNIKIVICAAVFPTLVLYGWTFWSKLVNPLMERYSEPKTPEEAILSLCIIAGFVTPIFFSFPLCTFGLWIGKVTKFYRDDKTRYVYFDNHSYFLRDMPQDQRDKIIEILSPYKSKVELRKERMASKSWLRRNFS